MTSSHQQKLAHALLPLAQLSSAVLRATGATTCTARFAEIQRLFQGSSDVSGLLKGVRRNHSTLHTTSLAHGSFPLHVYQHVVPASNVVKNASFHHQHGRERQQVVLHQGWHQSRHFRTHSITLKESKSTPEDCDRIVEEMRYRNIKVPKQLEISWRRRIEGWAVGAWNGGKAVVKFSFSLPGMLYRTITMSPSEWYKFLSGTWATVKHEAEYYWVGFKLFGFELRVATGLVWKRLKGGHLSRRERRQLTRTSADLIRVIPFSLFIIIPFAEALLPLAIRLFPNLLPSTFETPLKREEDLKKLLKLKTELAGFLQQTVGELAKDVKKSSSGEVADEAKALQVFLTDVRDGKSVNNNDIVKFARLFNDELTLDNLDRVHLLTLCQFLSLPTIPSTEAILRTRLQAHLVELRADDIEIKSEGIENLTDDEMRSAARARGMPAPFGRGCTTLLRKQLEDWIDLSLDKNIPSSLLLLSRAFKMTTLAKRAPSAEKSKDSATETVESLKDTFNMLPEEAIEGVEMERFKSSAGLQKRLEYLQREEEEIKEENEEENSKELSDARAALEESHSRLGKVVTTSAQATAKAVVRKAAAEAAQDAISRKQEETGDSAQSQVAYKDAREKEKKMGALISSLVALAHASGVAQERALFMEVASREVESQMVKLGGGSYLEFGGAKKQVSGVRPAEERVDHVTENMQASIQNMLIRIESELDAADSTIGQKLHLLDTDADGIVSKDELLNAMTLLRGNRSEAEVDAVKKLLDGRQTVTLEQLEELGQKLALSKSSKDDPAKGK